MSFRTLRAHIRRLRERGHPTREHLADLRSKLAFPLVPLVMVFVAIPLLLAAFGLALYRHTPS